MDYLCSDLLSSLFFFYTLDLNHCKSLIPTHHFNYYFWKETRFLIWNSRVLQWVWPIIVTISTRQPCTCSYYWIEIISHINLLTHHTSRDKPYNSLLHIIPPKIILRILIYLCTPGIHKIAFLMCFFHNFILQLFHIRHTQHFLKIQHTIPGVWPLGDMLKVLDQLSV